jgi:hypothetical protein
MTPTKPPTAAVHGPYEDLAIALIELFKLIIASQPEAVRAELWKAYAEDMKAWREFWKGLLPKV